MILSCVMVFKLAVFVTFDRKKLHIKTVQFMFQSSTTLYIIWNKHDINKNIDKTLNGKTSTGF